MILVSHKDYMLVLLLMSTVPQVQHTWQENYVCLLDAATIIR